MYLDPNYKWGMLFISTYGMIEILALYKKFLVENPNKIKIWTGYIDALTNGGNLNNARTALQQCT